MTLENYQKNLKLEQEKSEKRKKLTIKIVGVTLVAVGIIYVYKKLIK
jgi:hypothetical protein